MPKKKDGTSQTRRGRDKYNIAPKMPKGRSLNIAPKNLSIRGSLHRLKKKR